MLPEEYEPLLRQGAAVKGSMRINGSKISDAYVTVEGFPLDVFVNGVINRNRAFDGDVVVVVLLPKSAWRKKDSGDEADGTTAATIAPVEAAANAARPVTALLPHAILEDESSDSEDSGDEANSDTEEIFLARSVLAQKVTVVAPAPAPAPALAFVDPSIVAVTSTPSETAQVTLADPAIVASAPLQQPKLISPEALATEQRKSKLTIVRKSGEAIVTAMPIAPQPQLVAPAAVVTTVPAPSAEQLRKDMCERVEAAKRKAGPKEPLLQPVGVVVAIAEAHHTTEHAGFLAPMNESWDGVDGDSLLQFRPIDKRVPWGIVHGRRSEMLHQVFAQGGVKALSEGLFLAELLPWQPHERKPSVELCRALGEAGDIDAETEAILLEYNVPHEEFAPQVTACLPSLPWHIPEQELQSRRDLRNMRIFTIDPLTARDLDDALSCVPLPDGTFEVGVHIADVSYFVTPGNALDAEAKSRSTSVYLIQKVVPMLPRVLCEDLCSLNPGADRFAFSGIWRMTAKGEILSEWFGRSLIRSCCKLNYELAQAAIDGKVGNGENGWEGAPPDVVPPWAAVLPPYTTQDVVTDIRNMHKISRAVRKARYDNGAVSIGSAKLHIALDNNGHPIDAVPYPIHESNEMIEEFMLIANRQVAARLAKFLPDAALLRRHPEPNSRKLAEFVQFCAKEKLGEIDASSSLALGRSLTVARESSSRPYIDAVLTYFSVKPMQLAKYFSTGTLPHEEWRHYALAMDEYTHFTSPIRRYPDVLVHRQLEATILMEGTQRALRSDLMISGLVQTNDDLEKLCEHANDRKLGSRKVQDASGLLFLCLLVRETPMPADGVVLGFSETYISVYAVKYVFEKRVYLEDMPLLGSEYDKSSGTLTLQWAADPMWKPEEDDELTAEAEAEAETGTAASKIIRARKQLDFYFSRQNLSKDKFMKGERAKRKDKGVLVSVLLTFRKLKEIVGEDGLLVLRAAETSRLVTSSDDGLAIVLRSKPMAVPGAERQQCVLQKIHVFDVLQVTVGIRPKKRPLEPRISLLHPVEALQRQWQQQWEHSQPASPLLSPSNQAKGVHVVGAEEIAD